MCVCVCVCVYICVCMYVYVYIYIHAYTQTLVHTYTSWAFLRVAPFVRGTSFPVGVSFHDRDGGEKQIVCSIHF